MSRYDYSFDPNGDSTPARICRLVGRQQRVLELGCAAGAMSIVLQNHYDCQVTGLEADPDAAALASSHGIEVRLVNLEDPSWPSLLGDMRFDTILAADVLEHLHQPLACLQDLRQLLAPGGKIVVSVPNIAHSGVLAALLCDAFPYRDTGLLDRTHVHFFTRTSLVSMLATAGFSVAHLESADTGPWHPEFSEFWDLLPEGIRTLLAQNPAGMAFQIFAIAYASSSSDSDALEPHRAPQEQTQWFSMVTTQLDDVQHLQKELQTLRQEHDQTRADLLAIQQSTIWRWTALLRRLLR